jgi:hypothetical protein
MENSHLKKVGHCLLDIFRKQTWLHPQAIAHSTQSVRATHNTWFFRKMLSLPRFVFLVYSCKLLNNQVTSKKNRLILFAAGEA